MPRLAVNRYALNIHPRSENDSSNRASMNADLDEDLTCARWWVSNEIGHADRGVSPKERVGKGHTREVR